jgi:anti-anti-sigma factor
MQNKVQQGTGSKQAGRVLYAVHEGVHVLRFVGEIRHPLGPALERFLERLLKEKPKTLIIELGETRIVDSTCLGLLARMALKLSAQGLTKATVVSPRADITEVLRSMSFDRLFDIVGEMQFGPVEARELAPATGRDGDALLATMLGAHRTLMALSEHNRLQFKDVVEAMEQESKAHREDAEAGRRSA